MDHEALGVCLQNDVRWAFGKQTIKRRAFLKSETHVHDGDPRPLIPVPLFGSGPDDTTREITPPVEHNTAAKAATHIPTANPNSNGVTIES